MDDSRPTAGLPLSVGKAPVGLRVLLAAVFLTVGALAMIGGVLIARGGARWLAIVAVVPFGLVALVAGVYVLVPLSRFGVWLDHFLPTIGGRPGLILAAILWAASALLIAFGA